MAENKGNNTLRTVALFGGLTLGAFALWQYFKPQQNQFGMTVPPGGTLPGGYVNNTNAPQWAVWTNFGLQVANQLGDLITKIPWSQLPGGSANPNSGINWGDVTEQEIYDYLDAYGDLD